MSVNLCRVSSLPIVNCRSLQTDNFNIFQLVLVRRLLVLLPPNVGHVAPIVCSIRDIGGVGGVVDETIDTGGGEHIGQVVDHCLAWGIPAKVDGQATLCKGSGSYDKAGFSV